MLCSRCGHALADYYAFELFLVEACELHSVVGFVPVAAILGASVVSIVVAALVVELTVSPVVVRRRVGWLMVVVHGGHCTL